MKILYAGNLVNNGYYHTMLCRKYGIDMELLMQKNPEPSNDPLIYDPQITTYPNWIKFYNRQRLFWQISIINSMKKSDYDLIHAHVELPIFANISRKKFVAHTLGSDLSVMAFTNSIKGFLLRQAYKNAKVVIFSTPDQPAMLNKLKIFHKIYIPLLRNLNLFSSKISYKKNNHDDFIIFNPTTHIWKTKGNDKLIKGFSNFVKNHPKSSLILVDKGIDREQSKNLVKKLNIEKKVQFISWLTATKLSENYHKADVVADQFIDPGLGGIGIETIYSGKPLLSYCPEDCYADLHDKPPPIVDAYTAEEIGLQLERLLEKNVRERYCIEGKKWYLENLSPEKIFKKYQFLYESLLNGATHKNIEENIRDV